LAEIERFLNVLRDRMGDHVEREETVTEPTLGASGEFGFR